MAEGCFYKQALESIKSRFTFRGDGNLIYLPSLLAVTPSTVQWSPAVALVMIVCNIIAIALGKYGIKYQSVGPELPSPELFGGMGLPALLAVTSFGHLLGAGAIIGLATIGVL
ncbi:MAG: photosystem I reaction center subunit PsaK [Leptolyngbya sp. SIO4C1]|nr:photosystem I reaction center subunit PsaK [Leptolyngbya sp. SIO4C1]